MVTLCGGLHDESMLVFTASHRSDGHKLHDIAILVVNDSTVIVRPCRQVWSLIVVVVVVFIIIVVVVNRWFWDSLGRLLLIIFVVITGIR